MFVQNDYIWHQYTYLVDKILAVPAYNLIINIHVAW
jgi:hypothetical protein